MLRVTIYLQSMRGPTPFKTYYLSKKVFDRLRKDFTSYQKSGFPVNGVYQEAVSSNNESVVFLEFGSIAYIKDQAESNNNDVADTKR